MEILNVQALQRAIRKYRDAAAWLRAWTVTIQEASWQNLKDAQHQYPSADGVPIKSVVITVFNVKGNGHRLLTIISYQRQQVYIVDLLTHAEYNKNLWKNRL